MAQATVGGDNPMHVGLGYGRKQSEKAMETEPVSRLPLPSLSLFLPLGSCVSSCWLLSVMGCDSAVQAR